MKKKGKKKLNKKVLLVFILTLYLIIMVVFYVLNLPIKSITIEGNTLVTDEEILNATGLDTYPLIIKVSKGKVIKSLEAMSLIDSAKLSISIFGNVKITIQENKVLFYNKLNNTYVLDNEDEVCDIGVLGIPTLVNYTPSDIYSNLITKLSKIDSDIISLISEIEYSPDMKDTQVIDENRFLLRMNDGNYVYINIANFDNLSKYKSIYAALGDENKGVINLDSSSDKVLFQSFSSLEENEESEEVSDELS